MLDLGFVVDRGVKQGLVFFEVPSELFDDVCKDFVFDYLAGTPTEGIRFLLEYSFDDTRLGDIIGVLFDFFFFVSEHFTDDSFVSLFGDSIESDRGKSQGVLGAKVV